MQHTHEWRRTEPQTEHAAHEKTPKMPGFATNCESVQLAKVADEGFEQLHNVKGETGVPTEGAAKSGAVGAENGQIDPDLELVLRAWPGLSGAMRKQLVGIITESWK